MRGSNFTLVLGFLLLTSCNSHFDGFRAEGDSDTGYEPCFEAKMPELFSELFERIGERVCIGGNIVVETHGVYFPTLRMTPDSNVIDLYGDRIYLNLSFRSAYDRGLSNGERVEISGTLQLRDNHPCRVERCNALELQLE